MASKITRFLLKHFGSTGNVAEFGKIGSDTAGSPVNTKDPDTMQELAGYLSGLFAITNSGVEAPRLEDLNSLFYLVMRQLVYMAQSGVPEWIATEDYYTNSLARVGSRVYVSKTGVDGAANTGNDPATDTTNWIDFLDASRLTGTIPLENIPATLTGKTVENATNAVNAETAAACSGNAATATKLQTARTIGGVSFDGSANINLPGVNTAGNQNTSGYSEGVRAVTGTVLPTPSWVYANQFFLDNNETPNQLYYCPPQKLGQNPYWVHIATV